MAFYENKVLKIALRIILGICAGVVLATIGDLIGKFSAWYDIGITVGEWNFAIFDGAITVVWLVATGILRWTMCNNPIVGWIEMIGVGLLMIFWFAGFIAVATTSCTSYYDGYDDIVCPSWYTGLQGAGAAFGAFAWLACLALFIMDIMLFLNKRRTAASGGNVEAGSAQPDMANTGMAAPMQEQQYVTQQTYPPQQTYQQPPPQQPYGQQTYSEQQQTYLNYNSYQSETQSPPPQMSATSTGATYPTPPQSYGVPSPGQNDVPYQPPASELPHSQPLPSELPHGQPPHQT